MATNKIRFSLGTETSSETTATISPDVPKLVCCDHLKRALDFEDMHQVVDEICVALADVEFDTIAHRGVSGALIAPVVAYKMRKEQIIVRKNKGAGCASGRWVEGHKHARKYIVIDDLVSSGSTFIQTVFGVTAFTDNRAKFQCLVLYDSSIRVEKPDDESVAGPIGALVKGGIEKWEAKEHETDGYWF